MAPSQPTARSRWRRTRCGDRARSAVAGRGRAVGRVRPAGAGVPGAAGRAAAGGTIGPVRRRRCAAVDPIELAGRPAPGGRERKR